MTDVEVVKIRGWDVVRLTSELVQVDVLPGKGGDVISARWRPLDVDVLWRTPWGLRHQGAVGTGGDSVTALMESYPGGWQTVFPNGGDATVEHGVEWGMHGEAWLAPWDFAVGGSSVELTTRLVRSPFALRKRISLESGTLTVTETATNVGAVPIEAMWSHHPAFGAPLLSGSSRLETAARTVVVDDVRDTPTGDLLVGGRGDWPHAPGRQGGQVDLRALPSADVVSDRFAYLTDFERGWAALTNPTLGLRAELEWDLEVMPHAWLWLEARSTLGFPWYGAAYVLGIEPASSFPGQGIVAARLKTGTTLLFEAGQSRTATISLRLSAP